MKKLPLLLTALVLFLSTFTVSAASTLAPATGDDMTLYIIIGVVAVALLVLLFLFLPKNRR